MQRARASWREAQPTLDPKRLVFLDESGVSSKMARVRGRCRRGQRLVAAIPHGHWQTLTFIAALRHDRIDAPMVLDGPIDGAAFLTYVCHFLIPTLAPGDLVIADNLGAHKSQAVREAIEAAGASICFLPPYSPDLNPIELMFAKLKALLKRPPSGPSTISSRPSPSPSMVSLPPNAPTTLRAVRINLSRSR